MKHVYSLQEKIKADEDFTDLVVLLSDLYKELLPIPNGFIISHSGITKLSTEVDSKVKESILKEVIDQYESISGLTESYVNIFVFVKSNDNSQIIKDLCVYQVKGVQKIIFSIEDIINNLQKDVLKRCSDVTINILILKSNNCDSFGYAFSKNVLNNSDESILIEAAYGIPVNNLNIEYDTYIVDKESEKILEKHITEQKFMYIRGHDALPYKQIEVSVAWQKKQKIDDKHIKSLTKTIKIISEELQNDYEIHWMLDNGKMWIYYINQIDYIPKKKTEDIIFDDEINKIEIEVSNQTPKEPNDLQIDEIEKEPEKDVAITYIQNEINPIAKPLEDHTLSSKHSEFLAQINEDKFTSPAEQPEISLQMVLPAIQDSNMAINADENISLVEKNATQNLAIENNTRKESQKNVIYNHMNDSIVFKTRPLIEGQYYRGNSTVIGKATFNYESPSEDSILILEGFEDIRADLKVKGFIIVEPSEILAIRLYEHFKVPVITGAPLANRLLKEGEPIKIDPNNGSIFVSDPNANDNQKMNLSTNTEESDTGSLNVAIDNSASSQASFEEENTENQIDLTIQLEKQTNEGIEGESLSIPVEPEKEYIIQADVKSDISESSIYIAETNKEDKQSILESILSYVTEDKDPQNIGNNNSLDAVQGISESDQTKLWANSLQKLVRTSSEVNPQHATTAIDSINYELNTISTQSKEFNFDLEETYIHEINTPKKYKKYLDFIPTISKVYVHLIDEVIDSSLANYDGVIFSFTEDMPVGLNLLLQNLQIIGLEKKVLVICPPYESQALVNYMSQIHSIRSKFKNVSLILPDYRNKKDIVQMKQSLNKIGLKRSSTFSIYVNVSRMINVFRLDEVVDDMLVDGRYYDLFRLKMNMLGVEKLTASTKFVEGMRNLVTYLSQRDSLKDNSILDISGFEKPNEVAEYVFNNNFTQIACRMNNCDIVKTILRELEQKELSKRL